MCGVCGVYERPADFDYYFHVLQSHYVRDLLDALFTTAAGHLAATVALIIFGISYVLASRAGDIEV